MMTLQEAEQELVADLTMLEDWNDRYEYIISLGREAPPYPEEWRTEELEVMGCQSQVWLHAECREGRVFYQADSNALITKGLVTMLVQLYSGRAPAEIKGASLDFLRGVGLASHLTPSRVNGLYAMFKKIQVYAAESEQTNKIKGD
jgi:cysteine desulfuration protein SufE